MLKPEWYEWFFRNYRPIFVLYAVMVVVVTVQLLLLHDKLAPSGEWVPEYNNYLIFKQSWFHLINNQDLYIAFPKEHWDLFKYSPSFPLFFGPLAYLPDGLGLLLWNALNAFCLLIAVQALPGSSLKVKVAILLFVLIELITSLQIAQSNALMAGLIILAFAMLEKNRYFLAALFLTLTVFIKIFGLFGFALFLAYPNKVRFILASAVCSLALAFLPLLVVSFDQLIFLYTSWYSMLVDDHTASYGLSVMGWLTTWFQWSVNKNLVLLMGLFGLGLSFLRWKRFDEPHFRISLLGSLLIWMVIFNHKAESPTYIIAVAGVALWYYTGQRSQANFVLMILVFVFTVLAPTDIFPAFVRSNFLVPYTIKAVPCILVWVKIVFDTLAKGNEHPFATA